MLEDLHSRRIDPKHAENWWQGKLGTGLVTFEVLKEACLAILETEDPDKILQVEGVITALRMFPSAALKQLMTFRSRFIPEIPDYLYEHIKSWPGDEGLHGDWVTLFDGLKKKFGVYEEIENFDFTLCGHFEDLEFNKQERGGDSDSGEQDVEMTTAEG